MWFQTFGVVLTPDDFSLGDWPERAARAGLTTIALHHSVSSRFVEDFVVSEPGRAAVSRCRALGLEVEYELHAMRDLLPRELFARSPDMFRMNPEGARTPDANCCVHSKEAMDTVVSGALALCRRMAPSTGRYFLWGDDGAAWCHCPRCRDLGGSDQALLLENTILGALRKEVAGARLSHLVYEYTYKAPRQVKPEPGVFLEFAPIRRSFTRPLREQPDHLDVLDTNLAWFGTEGAQALEYWIDVSLFTHWKRPCARLPDRREIMAADLETYRKRGVAHVTSFAVLMDSEYLASHGELPLDGYAAQRR